MDAMKRQLVGGLLLASCVGIPLASCDTKSSCEETLTCKDGAAERAGQAGTAGSAGHAGEAGDTANLGDAGSAGDAGNSSSLAGTSGFSGAAGEAGTAPNSSGGGSSGQANSGGSVEQGGIAGSLPPPSASAGSGGGGAGGTAGTSGSEPGGGTSGSAGRSTAACSESCSEATPVCDTARGECVECLRAEDCIDSERPLCNAGSGRCVGCLSEEDCTDPTRPACDEASGECVECIESEHCGPGLLCDVQVRTCAECLDAGDCPAERPVCGADGECVECLDASDCLDEARPYCDEATAVCVECQGATDCDSPGAAVCGEDSACEPCTMDVECAGFEELGVCERGQCVECRTSEDCLDPTAPRCLDNVCSPCDTSNDCVHLAATGLGVCDPAQGACVECTGLEYECGEGADGPFVCDSLSRTCSDRSEGTAGLCQQCVSDAECSAGQRCILQQFEAHDVGYFCLWALGDTEHGAPADCFAGGRPYVRKLDDVVSIDGIQLDACGLRASTCLAKQEFSAKDCAPGSGGAGGAGGAGTQPGSVECGFAEPPGVELVDAVCVQPPGSSLHLCSMSCLSDADCPGVSACNTGVAEWYCEI